MDCVEVIDNNKLDMVATALWKNGAVGIRGQIHSALSAGFAFPAVMGRRTTVTTTFVDELVIMIKAMTKEGRSLLDLGLTSSTH